MISSPPLAWAFTLWFALLGAATLLALARVRGGGPRGWGLRGWGLRLSYLAHLVMCVAMATMPWSWSAAVPAIATITVFSLFTLGYLGLAVVAPTEAAPGEEHHGSRLLAVYHAAMMSAMVWMSVLMTMLADAAGGMSGMSGTGMSGTGMSGTSMSDTGMSHTGMHGTGMHGTDASGIWQLAPWALVVTGAYVALFAVAAVVFLVRLLRAPATTRGTASLSPRGGVLLNLAMALGMGASFLVMA
ncbi:MAG: DUF5134 domain-containing protein [Microbacteriaceae bacterium]